MRLQTLERIVFITEQLIAKNVTNSKDLVMCLLQQISVSKTDEQSVSHFSVIALGLY